MTHPNTPTECGRTSLHISLRIHNAHERLIVTETKAESTLSEMCQARGHDGRCGSVGECPWNTKLKAHMLCQAQLYMYMKQGALHAHPPNVLAGN